MTDGYLHTRGFKLKGVSVAAVCGWKQRLQSPTFATTDMSFTYINAHEIILFQGGVTDKSFLAVDSHVMCICTVFPAKSCCARLCHWT